MLPLPSSRNMTTGAAGAQALGYYYQVRYALHYILQCEEDSTFSIRLEGLDDIELWKKDQLRKLVELKHHNSANSVLTDRSVDLWRTIRIWCTHLAAGKITVPGTTLALITTAKVPVESVIGTLTSDRTIRNLDAIHTKMIEIATTASISLQEFTQPFLRLLPAQQKQLVSSIIVYQTAPNIKAIADDIKHQLRIASPSLAHLDDISSLLEQWWFDRIVEHLLGDSSSLITFNEVHARLHEITRGFGPDSLPILHRGDDPEPNPSITTDARQFVVQLRLIDILQERIIGAIRDHHRAYAERNHWYKKLIFDEKLNEYECRLEERWKEIYYTLQDRFRDDYSRKLDEYDDVLLLRFGRKLFEKVMELDIPIRPGVTEHYVTRGTFHRLADKKNDLVVRWHPNFSQTNTK